MGHSGRGGHVLTRLAIDVMGGDYAPEAPVRATCSAAREDRASHFLLIGDEAKIRSVAVEIPSNVDIVPTTEQIDGDEEPVRAVRKKKSASLVMAAAMVAEKSADAMISAGNTGAIVAAGLLVIGRMAGIHRPALAPVMPTFDGRGVLLLDAGAMMDAGADNLLQFAQMGSAYSEWVLGQHHPRIGLLNVGTEDTKGNALTKATFPLLKSSNLNFVGNIEAREVLSGICDVVVCDGFTGNVVLKLAEGLGLGIAKGLKETVTQSASAKFGAVFLKGSMRQFFRRFEYSEYGGAPFLGVNGGCFKAHGSSNERAWYVTIQQAKTYVEHDLNAHLLHALSTPFNDDGDASTH